MRYYVKSILKLVRTTDREAVYGSGDAEDTTPAIHVASLGDFKNNKPPKEIQVIMVVDEELNWFKKTRVQTFDGKFPGQ